MSPQSSAGNTGAGLAGVTGLDDRVRVGGDQDVGTVDIADCMAEGDLVPWPRCHLRADEADGSVAGACTSVRTGRVPCHPGHLAALAEPASIALPLKAHQ
jgi:hypothetical protein